MTRLADWSITQKLALVTLVTSMTALLVGSLGLGLYDRQNTKQATQERANQLASLIATTLESSLAVGDTETARNILDGLRSQRDIRAVAVYDANLQTFATFHTPLEGPAVVPADNQSFFTDDLFVVYRTISRGTERIGTVQVEIDLTSMNMRMQQFIVPVGVLMLLLPWAAWFASKGLQGFVSGPILELAETARTVSTTKDYSTRAIKRSNDEVGLLIDTFNDMLEQIQNRDDRLLGEGDRLEAEVGVRTRELRAANTRLETARMAAVAASHAKSEFIANMSHEIRTPMNGVMGMAELLINTDLSGEQQTLARTVWESAEDLLAIINDILDFSKGEAGKLQLDCAPFDPEECIDRVTELLSGRAKLKGLRIVHDVDSDIPRLVLGDAKRLRQILTNVVGNAIKFTERGDIVVRAAVVERREGSVKIRFEVIDGGIGIPVDAQSRIFDGFSQGDSSTTRKFGGTGLGLAISKHLAGLMGGKIGVVSRPGIGSNFWFTVQVERSLDDTAAANLRHFSDLGALRILVACSSTSDRQVVNEWLDAWDSVCVAAPTGEEAIAKLHAAEAQGQPFDVVLVDLHGTGMNSAAFARVVRADPTTRGLHLVLLTSSEDAAVDLDGVGCDAAISKPLKQLDLLSRLLKVPYRAGSATNHPTAPTTHHDGPTAEGTRVLVAEDNAVNQEVATSMLQRLGCSVDVVPEGSAAVEAVRSRHYDLVFLDCQMPEVDGYQAARQIRRLEERGELFTDGPAARPGRLPLVALTAHSMPADREQSLESGMDDFVTKPFSLQDLRDVMDRWLLPNDVSGCVQPDPTAAEHAIPAHRHQHVNPSALEQMLQLDRHTNSGVLDRVVRIYLEESPATLKTLRRGVGENDAERIAAAAHSLRSASLNVGAEQLAAICKTLEALGRRGTTEGAARLVAEIEEAYSAVEEELGTLIQTQRLDDTVRV